MVNAVPAYKERLRTMLLEAELAEKIDQLKPVRTNVKRVIQLSKK